MGQHIINVIFGLLGLVASASAIIAMILAPFALYKGFKHKNWKLGKIALIMFASGIALQVIVLGVWAAIKSASGG